MLNIKMDMDVLILYIVAAILTTVAFVMLYMEARKNRLPKKEAEGSHDSKGKGDK